MNTGLPAELTSLRAFLPELIAEARKRVPYASALVTQSGGEMVVKNKSEELVNPLPPQPGIRITVWDGATFHSVATSRIDDPGHLLDLTRELAGSVTLRDGPLPDVGPALDRHFRSEPKRDPKTVDAQERREFCRHAYEVLTRTDPRIVSAQVGYSYRQEFRLFANHSRLLSSEISNVAVTMVPFALENNHQVMNFFVRNEPGDEAARVTDDEIAEVTATAVASLKAEKIPPGEYRVILDPEMSGVLAHESFGHGCELDTMMRGAARALQYIGRRVGSDMVNIHDFGGLPGHHGSIFFSDDGVVSEEPVVLVKNGILQPTMLTDLYSYTMVRNDYPGLKLSASGRLETYDHPIYARMSNTYVLPLERSNGGMTRDELIADTGEGVLVERMMSGMEDPLGWGIQLQALRGREIKSGRLSGRQFYRLGLSGYVPDVLSSVDGVTTKLELRSIGYCGKGHKEYVRDCTGGPYVRCRMNLG